MNQLNTNEGAYIKPNKTWKCRIGLHLWTPVHQGRGMSICYRCNLLDDGYIKRTARVKKNGAVL
jgi:hypothetical protein